MAAVDSMPPPVSKDQSSESGSPRSPDALPVSEASPRKEGQRSAAAAEGTAAAAGAHTGSTPGSTPSRAHISGGARRRVLPESPGRFIQHQEIVARHGARVEGGRPLRGGLAGQLGQDGVGHAGVPKA